MCPRLPASFSGKIGYGKLPRPTSRASALHRPPLPAQLRSVPTSPRSWAALAPAGPLEARTRSLLPAEALISLPRRPAVSGDRIGRGGVCGGAGVGGTERAAGRGCLLGNQDSRVTAGWTRQRRRKGMLWASRCASLPISRRGALASPSCRGPWVRAPWALASNGLTTRTQNPHCQLSSALGVIPLPSSASLVTLRLPGLVQS